MLPPPPPPPRRTPLSSPPPPPPIRPPAPTAETLFARLADLPPDERQRILHDEQIPENAELTALLAAHDYASDSFLEDAPADPDMQALFDSL